MSDDRIVRVHYYPQQFLRTEDFQQEQAYHIQMRRRHNIAHHVWGIVTGLKLCVEEDGPVVLPGMAVDGYGRELILTERKRISGEEFTHRNSDELNVWLQYGISGTDETPAGYYKTCNDAAQANYYRSEEIPLLILEATGAGYLDPRQPKAVAPEDLAFSAARTPPDDPATLWPVYLGKLVRDRSKPDETVYKVEPAGRPSAGLVGEGIASPSGRALMGLQGKVVEVTDETGVSRSEVRPSRFNVSLTHAPHCDENNPLKEHLSITSAGEIDLRGRATIHGDLRMAGGAVAFTSPFLPAGEEPPCDSAQEADMARPWRMYRYRCSRPAEDGGLVADEQELVDELRVELSPVDEIKQQLVIGAWSPEEEAFKPFLTVGNVNHPTGSYSVTVHGNLIVKGAIEKQEARVPRKLSAEARNFLLGSYASGVSGANLQLVDHYKSPFIPTDCDLESDAGQTAVIQALLQPGDGDRPRMVRFVEKMLQTLEARQEIETQLALNPGFMGELMTLALPVESSRAQIISSLLADATAHDELETALVADATSLRSVTQRAVAADAPMVAEVLLDDAAGATAAGQYLATELADMSAVLVPVLNSDPARDRLASDLLAHANGSASIMDGLAPGQVPDRLSAFSGQLQQAAYADRLPAFANALAATDAGRRALVEHGLPETAPATHLTAFAQRVQADYPLWLEEFLSLVQTSGGSTSLAENLLGTAAGRSAIMTAMRDDATALDAFTALLEDTASYASVLPEFTESLLASGDGRTGVGDRLVADTSLMAGVLTPVLADGAARAELSEQLLSHADGPTAVGENLTLVANATRWEDILEPVLDDTADATSRDALAEVLGSDENGRIAFADYLESLGPAPASGTPLGDFGELINSPDPADPASIRYPELRSVICA